MSFSVTILGSSGAVPAYGRFPTSQLISIGNHHMLVDCGEGTQIQLMKQQTSMHRINHIFISHLHGDHYLGLMGLLFTMHLQHRKTDLHLFSQRGLDEIITTHLRWSNGALGFKVHYHSLPAGQREIIWENDKLSVETIPLTHRIDCSGFLFREKPKPRRIDKDALPPGLPIYQLAHLKRGEDITNADGTVIRNIDVTRPPKRARAYAFCSDTAFVPELADQLKEIDLLYHEATFGNDEASKAIETCHSTAAQAGELASLANVRRLLIGHFSARYKDLTPLLAEAKSKFDNTELAVEGLTFDIAE